MGLITKYEIYLEDVYIQAQHLKELGPENANGVRLYNAFIQNSYVLDIHMVRPRFVAEFDTIYNVLGFCFDCIGEELPWPWRGSESTQTLVKRIKFVPRLLLVGSWADSSKPVKVLQVCLHQDDVPAIARHIKTGIWPTTF